MAVIENVKLVAQYVKDKIKDFYEDNEDEIIITGMCVTYLICGGLYGYFLGNIVGFGKGFDAGRLDVIKISKMLDK